MTQVAWNQEHSNQREFLMSVHARRCGTFAVLLAVLSALWLAGCGQKDGEGTKSPSAPEAQSQSVPKPLPKDIVDAWTKAGAHAGWSREVRTQTVSVSGFFASSTEPMAGDVPGFSLVWRPGIVAKLPPPEQPFALYFDDLEDGPHVSDAGLKELAGMKSLQRLYLTGAPITDAGLKELVSFKGLQMLDLSGTKVTHAGVKNLQQALPNCKILGLESD
jgi:hypothetical protein